MASRLNQVYISLFREYPFLARAAAVTGVGQLAFALINIYALPLYLFQDLHLSGKTLGAASATFLLCETVLKFPMGRLSDRLGRKPLVVFGPLVACANPILYVALPPPLWPVVFPLRALDGVGAAALWPPLFAMVGDLVRDHARAAAMSVMNTVYVSSIGLAILAGSFGAYITGSHLAPFYIASCLLVISAATAYLGLPRGSQAIAAGPDLRSRERQAHPESTAAEEAPGRATIMRCPMSLVLLISLLMSAGVLMLANFLILYLTVDLGLSAGQLGSLFAPLAVLVVLFGLPLGRAADRLGTARAVRLSLVVSAAMMWLIPSCRTVACFGAAAVILVTSHILGTPAWLALVSQLAPTSRRGGAMAIVATAEGVGAVLGPPLAGWLWDIHHGFIFYGSAVLLSLAAILALLALRQGEGEGAG
jgi:DHA1 family multidrug resistance protein-like MFS transporter